MRVVELYLSFLKVEVLLSAEDQQTLELEGNRAKRGT